MQSDTLRGFILRTLLWLPVCFAAWYMIAHYHAGIAGAIARVFINGLQSGLVTALEHTGPDFVFVTSIAVTGANGATGVLVPEVNPLVYTYGLALFAALMLGSRAKPWKLLIGVIALLPFQAWGIAFDFLVQVGVKMGAQISAQAGIIGWQREAIALCYQLGMLIFPSLMPVVLWTLFNRSFMERVFRLRAPIRHN